MSAAFFPTGAETSVQPGLRQPLWDRPGNPLLDETFVQADATVQVTPAYTRAGIGFVFQPATIFELRVRYSAIGFYDAFTAVYLFDDPDAVYDAALRATMDRTTGWGGRLLVEPTIRMKGGPIVFVGWSAVRHHTLHPGETTDQGDYWLEPELGLMLRYPGTSWDHNALLTWEVQAHDTTLYLGGYLDYRTAGQTSDELLRVGPAAVWMPEPDHWTVIAICQFYAFARLRDGPVPPYTAFQVQYRL
ncbi:MAG: hypothetical protein D6798_18030 [Deltaproteobacteria bacterium]|nr:MAG: hypothetical protein D6798_18030 [Deltaproteobacteria bacterium]